MIGILGALEGMTICAREWRVGPCGLVYRCNDATQLSAEIVADSEVNLILSGGKVRTLA